MVHIWDTETLSACERKLIWLDMSINIKKNHAAYALDPEMIQFAQISPLYLDM